MEIVGSMVHQLLDGVTPKQMREAGLDSRYVEHGLGIYPMDSVGVPYSAASFQSKGDPVTDLYENMAAEQKARSTYEYLLDQIDDEDVAAPLRFLREREVVHFQRFGDTKPTDLSRS